MQQFHLALSGEEEQQYVSQMLLRDKVFITGTLATGGVLMICGSLSMQKDVLAVLENICREAELPDVEFYREKGQLRMDCY